MIPYPAALAAAVVFGCGYFAASLPALYAVPLLLVAWAAVHLLAVWVAFTTAPGWDTFDGIEGDD